MKSRFACAPSRLTKVTLKPERANILTVFQNISYNISYNSEALAEVVAKWATGKLKPVFPSKSTCRACVASYISCLPIRVFMYSLSKQQSTNPISSYPSAFRFILNCHFIY